VNATPSLYERIGTDKVERLVAAFYARVDRDPVIRRFYGKTLSCAIRGLTDFMSWWLGGPPTYDVPRARLRRRHLPFTIDDRAADAWLANMDSKGQTPLRRAVDCRQIEVVQLLVQRGANPRAADNRGVTPLEVARTAEMKQALKRQRFP
jgi:truncated hemoglobin YjbI